MELVREHDAYMLHNWLYLKMHHTLSKTHQ
jgi:hypothetical protein